MADQGMGQPRPAGWKKDPSSRHFGRYWDGQQWTEHVISAEKVQSIDPLPHRPEPSLFKDSPPPPAPPRRSTPARPTAPTIPSPVPTEPGFGTPAPTRVAQVAPPTEVMRESQVHGVRSLGGLVPPQPLPRRAWDGFRRWPRWAQWTLGVVLGLTIIGALTDDGDEDRPVSVVGDIATTLTSAVTTTQAPATSAPATTVPLTTVTEPPATTRATTALTSPPVTRAPTATTEATAPTATRPSSVSYANCTAVRAAGAAPIYRGEPGYGAHLDRDNDGIACE